VTAPETKRPTIRDVALVAGVSRGTVSRVLNGGKWVSPEAAAAVSDAIKRTKYRVNPHARNLATNKSNSIAFLLTEPHHVLFDDPTFSQLVRGMAEALAVKKMSFVLIIAGTPAEQERATEYITAGHVDGVLLAFSSKAVTPLLKSLIKAGIPVVAAGQPLGFEGKVSSVSADDFTGARDMVEYLASTGRTRIATITGPDDTPGGVGRLAGYRAAVGDGFDEAYVAHGDYGWASGVAATESLLRQAPDLDAIFAASDVMAAAAITVLRAAGKQVPGDVAVAGFDDSVFSYTPDTPLTTMHQPFDRISSEMVRLLLGMIGGDQPATITLPTTLIRRKSA
jgi:DNA-binding LacI/PurR family transcriptional regulator